VSLGVTSLIVLETFAKFSSCQRGSGSNPNCPWRLNEQKSSPARPILAANALLPSPSRVKERTQLIAVAGEVEGSKMSIRSGDVACVGKELCCASKRRNGGLHVATRYEYLGDPFYMHGFAYFSKLFILLLGRRFSLWVFSPTAARVYMQYVRRYYNNLRTE
jgi:hypothetical protein